jgi:uncharacterized protein YpuA (DUF1002 family)
MNKNEIQSHIENLAEDFGIEITTRQANKFVNLSIELMSEVDICYDEILQEFKSISPSDEDEWLDFLEEVSDFVYDLISEETEDDESEETEDVE